MTRDGERFVQRPGVAAGWAVLCAFIGGCVGRTAPEVPAEAKPVDFMIMTAQETAQMRAVTERRVWEDPAGCVGSERDEVGFEATTYVFFPADAFEEIPRYMLRVDREGEFVAQAPGVDSTEVVDRSGKVWTGWMKAFTTVDGAAPSRMSIYAFTDEAMAVVYRVVFDQAARSRSTDSLAAFLAMTLTQAGPLGAYPTESCR